MNMLSGAGCTDGFFCRRGRVVLASDKPLRLLSSMPGRLLHLELLPCAPPPLQPLPPTGSPAQGVLWCKAGPSDALRRAAVAADEAFASAVAAGSAIAAGAVTCWAGGTGGAMRPSAGVVRLYKLLPVSVLSFTVAAAAASCSPQMQAGGSCRLWRFSLRSPGLIRAADLARIAARAAAAAILMMPPPPPLLLVPILLLLMLLLLQAVSDGAAA